MKVMSFNLRCDFILDFKNRWDSRKELVFKVLDNYEPDIIGVQELTNKMHKDLISKIDRYNVVGQPRSKRFFVERNDILISKKYKILSNKTFWLSDKPEKVSTSKWYSIFPRICTTAVIEDEEGHKIRICNSHLDFLFSKAREFEIKKIVEYVEEEQRKEEMPTIILGDFNAKPDSVLVKNMKNGFYSDRKFIASKDIDESLYEMSTMSKFKGNEKGLHIDYIFVTNDVDIIKTKIVRDNFNGKYPSDHYPLVTEIELG